MNVDWSQLSIGVAAVACLFGVVHMFMKFLTNCMSKQTKVLDNLVNKTERLAGKIDRCPEHKE